MVPVALACIWIGGVAFSVLVALIAVGMMIEWARLCRAGTGPRPVLMAASLPIMVLLTTLNEPGFALALLGLVTLVAWPRRSRVQGYAGDERLLPIGVPYIAPAVIALIWLRGLPAYGLTYVIVLLLVIWATDIGAYVAGRAIGGRKLAPTISPGKTWSGAAGGLLAGMLVGFFAADSLGFAAMPWRTALTAGLIGCIGQAGDLLESGLKRHFKVKDSGSLIPGHGGLLDRLDAVLTAAPVAALLAFALGRGVMPWQ
jgi:phosphatidate cytidylyltransferase